MNIYDTGRGRAFLKIEYIKQYVKDNIRVGDKFKAPRDVYNVDRPRLDDLSERTVEHFYPDYVLTIDEVGRRETFQYFDMYNYLRGIYGCVQ